MQSNANPTRQKHLHQHEPLLLIMGPFRARVQSKKYSTATTVQRLTLSTACVSHTSRIPALLAHKIVMFPTCRCFPHVLYMLHIHFDTTVLILSRLKSHFQGDVNTIDHAPTWKKMPFARCAGTIAGMGTLVVRSAHRSTTNTTYSVVQCGDGGGLGRAAHSTHDLLHKEGHGRMVNRLHPHGRGTETTRQ